MSLIAFLAIVLGLTAASFVAGVWLGRRHRRPRRNAANCYCRRPAPLRKPRKRRGAPAREAAPAAAAPADGRGELGPGRPPSFCPRGSPSRARS